MEKLTMNTGNVSRWDARFFTVAGSFMLINTMMLWLRLYSNFQMSILWAAIPAIIGFTFSVFGLLKLHQHVSVKAPLVAKSGAGFAILACSSLGIAALWIFIDAVFGEGMPEQRSQLFLILIAVFMVAMVLAFLSNAIAFLRHSAQRNIGYLLTVPLFMWSIMLVVGAIKGMESGLSLDYYTNAVIGMAFLRLGFTLKAAGQIES